MNLQLTVYTDENQKPQKLITVAVRKLIMNL